MFSPSFQLLLCFTADQVRGELRNLQPRKAAGFRWSVPHPPLKACATELVEPLQQVFNLSLHLVKVLTLWMMSCIVPVPQKNWLWSDPGATCWGLSSVCLPGKCWCGRCHPLPATLSPLTSAHGNSLRMQLQTKTRIKICLQIHWDGVWTPSHKSEKDNIRSYLHE